MAKEPVTPIHIRVSPSERRLFEAAADRAGLSITEMIKKAVLAFVRSPMPKDEFAEALDRLEKFKPTAEQLAEHRAAVRRIESGKFKGLKKKEGLALLAELQSRRKRQ